MARRPLPDIRVADVTVEQMLNCAQRELGMRHSVYPNLVQKGKMSAAKAHEETVVMTAIVAKLKAELHGGTLL